jgi:hypothetical protein
MTAITPDDLLEALVFWWRFEKGWIPVEGYPTECPSTAGFKASRQHDDTNGAFDTDERGRWAQQIGHAVNRVPQPHRTALYVLARNRATGASVWMSPRLPADDVERAQMVADAVDMLGRELGL